MEKSKKKRKNSFQESQGHVSLQPKKSRNRPSFATNTELLSKEVLCRSLTECILLTKRAKRKN